MPEHPLAVRGVAAGAWPAGSWPSSRRTRRRRSLAHLDGARRAGPRPTACSTSPPSPWAPTRGDRRPTNRRPPTSAIASSPAWRASGAPRRAGALGVAMSAAAAAVVGRRRRDARPRRARRCAASRSSFVRQARGVDASAVRRPGRRRLAHRAHRQRPRPRHHLLPVAHAARRRLRRPDPGRHVPPRRRRRGRRAASAARSPPRTWAGPGPPPPTARSPSTPRA